MADLVIEKDLFWYQEEILTKEIVVKYYSF